ncbi:hypothetical protein PsorP6_012505 [Peronosclerospora sorghi]|uniref:Uncharacterized protein n=1 Tax=Peronosclerospora sorghi TaxID=230839 RepID=A0ACC0WGY6_9STRA|nr:hypothetical protein PsorP6_012505 [Peronosclerospora sorghi]
MRVSKFLVATLAACSTLCTVTSPEKQFLRHPKAVLEKTEGGQDEDRCGFFCYFFNTLPKQFKRMLTEPEYETTTFNRWKNGWVSDVDAHNYMVSEDVPVETIQEILKRYKSFLRKHQET